tara:strand:- start:178 stop:957 length:780 start_codon:yes stop_codon:yes gene_type:complete
MGKRSSSVSNSKKERRMKRKKLEQRKRLEKNKKHIDAKPALEQENLPYDYSKPVYKFFEKEEYADALLCGNVHLGTLNVYRGYEDAEQGDSEEAYETYRASKIVGSSNDPKVAEQLRRCSIRVEGCDNIVVTHARNVRSLPDAYVFCTSTEYLPENMSEKIGTKYCVKIKDPERFFDIVSRKIMSISPMHQGAMGKVVYKDRHYSGLRQPPGPIGFVKPAFPYEKQKEFRFLWLMKDSDNLKPFQLSCPEISDLCERIA